MQHPSEIYNSLIILACNFSFSFYVRITVLSREVEYLFWIWMNLCTVYGKTTYEWHTDDIRVHTSDIRMTYEYIRVRYGWHTSTYKWHTDDIRVTYGWHTSTYERHTDAIRVYTSDIRMTYEYIRVAYGWYASQIHPWLQYLVK